MKLVFLLIFSALISSCAYSGSHVTGRDITRSQVASIQKGKTNTDELVAILGQPDAKTLVSATEEKWAYGYAQTSTNATYFPTTKIVTIGTQKTLDVLIKDEVVVNFVFTEKPVDQVIGQ